MSDAVWIAVVMLLGGTQALQVALLGAMNRARGPTEAAYLSIFGTVAAMSLGLTIRGLMGSRPVLPFPFDQVAVTGALTILGSAILIGLLRGLPGMYFVTGVFAMPYLLAAAYLAPKLGVGLFLAALIAGQLSGGVLLDHFAAFGAAARPVDAVRVIGIGVLLAGVILVRGFR